MQEIFAARSTNGRWGMAIVGPEGAKLPAQGSVAHLGTIGGMSTYQFAPGETGTWVMVADDVKVHGGATLVEEMHLQSNNSASIILVGQEAVVEHIGYKGRGSHVVAYVRGERVDIPASVLLAMGLAIPESGPAVVVEPPPALSGPMAAAFAKLRKEQQ